MNRIRASDDGKSITPSASYSKENSPTPQTPNLALSRESTPYVYEQDHLDDTTSKSISTSDVYANGESISNSLDYSRAQLKRLADGFPRSDASKKKVTAKTIEKNWVPLDKECLNSFIELSSSASNKVKDQLQNSSNRQAKILETERLLSSHWTSETLPKSFCTRLKVTKLPSIKSLPIKSRDSLDMPCKPLEVELVEKRRAHLEEHLRTELKELEKLEAYYNSAKKLLDQDQEYFTEFQKTKMEVKLQLKQEIQENRNKYKLHGNKVLSNNLKLYSGPMPGASSPLNFDPKEDQQVSNILKTLDSSISTITPIMPKFEKHMRRIKLIEQKLISPEYK